MRKYWLSLLLYLMLPTFSYAQENTETPRFKKIMVLILENTSFSEIKDQPAFKKMLAYAKTQNKDELKNAYLVFNNYYNNHEGGTNPSHPSQPNYLALTSGSTHNIKDNEIH